MPALAIVMGLDGRCSQRIMPDPVATAGIEIGASVGERAANRFEDVRTIQDALNQVPVGKGGPEPPLKVDGLCYGKTLAAIRRFQKVGCGFKWPDGRVEPNRRTHQELGRYFVPANPYVTPLAYHKLKEVERWIDAALRVVVSAEDTVRGARFVSPAGYAMVDEYFHIDELTTQRKLGALQRLRDTYMKMKVCVGHDSALTRPGTGFIQEDRKTSDVPAYTFSGGFERRRASGLPPMSWEDYAHDHPNIRQDTVVLCPRMLSGGSEGYLVRVIVHELAHFCGPSVGDQAIGDHGYQGKPGFKTLSHRLAMRTADCYSTLAGRARLGTEPPLR